MTSPAPFPDHALTDDALIGGRVRLLQPRHGYRAATDPVLLAAAAAVSPGEAVLDLGCGAGAAVLCLAARIPGLGPLHGLEIQPPYADLARRNAARAGTALTVHEGDALAPPASLKSLSFDHLLSNPPWHDRTGSAAPDAGRDRANREAVPAGDWVRAALRRLAPRGRLTLIHRAHRLAAILAALEGRAGDIRILPLQSRAGRPAGRVLITARKGARGPLSLLAPLALHAGAEHGEDADDFTPAATAVLRDGAPLHMDP